MESRQQRSRISGAIHHRHAGVQRRARDYHRDRRHCHRRTDRRSAARQAGRMCIMLALTGTLDVPLRSPLGDRQVFSAA